MNRIRVYNNKYQVLLTPFHRFDAGFEFLLGNWTDERFGGFKIEEFDTLKDAMNKSLNYPQINWDQMTLYHRDIYNKLHQIIDKIIDKKYFTLTSRLLRPDEIKNLFFDRVIHYGDRFRLLYNMNDIIQFQITTKYTNDVQTLMKYLSTIQSLRILFKINDKSGARLVGKTDIGTTYQIVIWTNLIAHWGNNMNDNIVDKVNSFDKIIKSQIDIDKTYE